MFGAEAPLTRAVLLLFVLAGCRSREPSNHAGASSSTKASSVPVASTRAPARPPPPAPVVGCRALAVTGPSPPPPGTPPVGTFFTGRSWLELAAGVELSLKHSETTREFALRGPGRFLVCSDGDEAVLVASGTVIARPGPGSRAGAEVMLGTPFGVVSYADAALTLVVSADKLVLDVQQGAATVGAVRADERPGGAPSKPVRAPAGHLALGGKVDPADLASRCSDAQQSLSGSARPAPSAGPERGKWAAGLLEARKASRLTCSRARSAVGRVDAPERARLESLLTARKPASPSGVDPTANEGSDAGK